MKSGGQYQKALSHLKIFCEDIPERSVGSEGNRMATTYFEGEIRALGWDTEIQQFDAVDWKDGGASLRCGDTVFNVLVSPYSLGCELQAPLVNASNLEELRQLDMAGKIVLLHGAIAREQIMPKNFVFYNPEHHKQIIATLESGKPAAIICATGRDAAVAGGVYPFPLIEDGDFDIPSVYMTAKDGTRLLAHAGTIVQLESKSTRIPGSGCNVIARKGQNPSERIIVSAHIDAKKGTPGAIDNATGVVVLLLLAELMADYDGSQMLELVAFNGEDYYAVPGQMLYISKNQDRFGEILLNINIDGAGHKGGKTAFSFYGLPEELQENANAVIRQFDGIIKGEPWPQGDHTMFVQNGRPAIAVTSQWFSENMDDQDITHTPKDNLGIVDAHKLVEIALALKQFIKNCS